MPQITPKSNSYSRWFRVYDEIIDDIKVQSLPPHLFKTWINLLALASKNGGTIPHVGAIAFRLRMSPQDATNALDELIHLGLIDIAPDGSWRPHNWLTRQYRADNADDPTNAERQRKWRGQNRLRKNTRNGPHNGSVTQNASVSVSESVLIHPGKEEVSALSHRYGGRS